MTLGTDIRLATEVCREVSRRLHPRVLVAPPLPWGLSDHHLGFPGTISLHPDTFYAVLRDVVTSLLGHGFRRYLLVNGHGGNMALTDVVCTRLRRETAVEVVGALTYFTLSSTQVGHGGEVEASYALALAPDVVRSERLRAEVPAGALPDVRPAIVPWAFHELTHSGNLGDPTLASAEKGRAMLAPMLDRLCEIVIALGEQAPPFQRSLHPAVTPGGAATGSARRGTGQMQRVCASPGVSGRASYGTVRPRGGARQRQRAGAWPAP